MSSLSVNAATREGDWELRQALDAAIEVIEWTGYRRVEVVAEYIDVWPRYETEGQPNKAAMQRANEIRQIAGYELVDYAKLYPGCGFKYRPIPNDPSEGGEL